MKKISSVKLQLAVQYVCADREFQQQVSRPQIRRWVKSALQMNTIQQFELVIRFASTDEMHTLNLNYRGKDYATNVLTFNYLCAKNAVCADIVLCIEVLKQEASAQKKSLLAHTAHLIIHGVLHAQGFDHEDLEDAQIMQSLEISILKRFGIADPYL